MSYVSSTGSHRTVNGPLSSRPQVTDEDDETYLLQYLDSDYCEQHISCQSIYEALVWAREEAHEHACNVRIYKLHHTELAP